MLSHLIPQLGVSLLGTSGLRSRIAQNDAWMTLMHPQAAAGEEPQSGDSGAHERTLPGELMKGTPPPRRARRWLIIRVGRLIRRLNRGVMAR